MRQQQHGDVLLQQVKKLPEGVQPIKRQNGYLVLAGGETTGHAHTIAGGTADLWVLNNQMYLEVKTPVIITHEEHKPQEIPAGVYKIGIVQEYDYLGEMVRAVRD